VGGGCIKRDAADKLWVSPTGDSERLPVDPGILLPVQPTSALLVERLRYSHTKPAKTSLSSIFLLHDFSASPTWPCWVPRHPHPL
jgi:hypothetical protein